jgi:hypothetical protein
MAQYRIYRLDPAGRITATHPLECRSDGVALTAACHLWRWAAAVEVWDGGRRVGRLEPVPPGDRLRVY